MSRSFKDSRPSSSPKPAGAHGPEDDAAISEQVRRLIAGGNSKAALDHAKESHRVKANAASEALLIEAYAARIQALAEQDLHVEAASLRELVLSRYPAAKTQLDGHIQQVNHMLEEMLAPLNDPDLSTDRKAAIDAFVRTEVRNLAALAGCAVIAEDHPLRQAAGALEKAFAAVTTGPVTEDQMALPEVSRRSPLAPWKLLIRAIAYLYRDDEARCREALDAIPPDSAPARLAGPIRTMLGESASLTPGGQSLVSQTTPNSATLRGALEALDQSFESIDTPGLLKAIRIAVAECRKAAPEQLELLRQHISVRCATRGLDVDAVLKALDGPALHDAYFTRLFARGMETGDPEDVFAACGLWDEFRQKAVAEGWFPERGPEVATLYLHVAGVLRKLPPGLWKHLMSGRSRRRLQSEELYFFNPGSLYERACLLDPHPEAFSDWLEWAKGQRKSDASAVAKTWHKARPMDMEPVLYLMRQAVRTRAFPTALKYLTEAEQLDGVHPEVRRARLRLLVGSIIKHIQQKKPHLAATKLEDLEKLPQAEQGDRPALVEALWGAASAASGLDREVEHKFGEIQRLMGSRIAAALLFARIAVESKIPEYHNLPLPETLGEAERAALPVAVARVFSLANDMDLPRMALPQPYLEEAWKQLRRNGKGLDTNQLLVLGDVGIGGNHDQLAYEASAQGMARGGATEGRFLLLRARALAEWQEQRRDACAAAAAELGRQHRDMQLVEEAVEFLQKESDGISLTAEQAGEILRREKAAKGFPSRNRPGPKYSDLLPEPLCQCADCEAKRRGEFRNFDPPDPYETDESASEDPFDAELEEMLANFPIPPDMPPEVARILMQEVRRAIERGESLDSLMSRLFGRGMPNGKSGKGRRR